MPKVRADLHMHSIYSDGEPEPERILLQSLKKGLEVISITDHDTFMGSIEAMRKVEEKKLKILLVPGSEVRTSIGDVLIYCMTPVKIERNIPLDKLIQLAESFGCLLVPAHPFDRLRRGIGEMGLEILSNSFRAMECFNASSSYISNRKAYKYAKDKGKACLANSDAHTLAGIGSFKTLIDMDLEEGIEGFWKAFERNSFLPVLSVSQLGAYLDKLRWSIKRKIIQQFSKK